MKIYIVYTTGIEMFYIHGVFTSKEELEAGLDILANDPFSLKQAERQRSENHDWYYKIHLMWASRVGKPDECEDGCEHKPSSLFGTLWDVARSLYSVYEIETNQPLADPYAVGFSPDEIEALD